MSLAICSSHPPRHFPKPEKFLRARMISNTYCDGLVFKQYQWISRKVIRALTKMTNGMQSGDESGLKNVGRKYAFKFREKSRCFGTPTWRPLSLSSTKGSLRNMCHGRDSLKPYKVFPPSSSLGHSFSSRRDDSFSGSPIEPLNRLDRLNQLDRDDRMRDDSMLLPCCWVIAHGTELPSRYRITPASRIGL